MEHDVIKSAWSLRSKIIRTDFLVNTGVGGRGVSEQRKQELPGANQEKQQGVGGGMLATRTEESWSNHQKDEMQLES